ncbi:MAG: altronate dehydratase, partial [Candidatus Hydrogenedentota bacterium]
VSVPTLKISSNTELAARKKGWIDFDAGRLLSEGASLDDLRDELYAYVLRVASGEYVQNEINGYREIGIWKSGVTV